ncbi:MAG TPA: PIG-L family deacetylase [Verrucomicrobiae bacterium]|jgi:LmbE family N-acetylglucosaminyl deacetylase
MNPYSKFVSDFARIVAEGKSLPLGGFAAPTRPAPAADAPVALFFAPHPDDETIAGGLALRLMREAGWQVINAAVTLGSLESRKAARWEELRNACHYLGFGLESLDPSGMAVRTSIREADPEAWSRMTGLVAELFEKHRPKAIFFSHEHDWNSTHIGEHFLVMDALKESRGLQCHLFEMEFWGQMQSPNLMVEYTPAIVEDLVAATSFHVGEVQRNPYHLVMPAWFMDNVRRGAELVGGQGGAAPGFLFAQLFRMRRWNGSQAEDCLARGRFLPASENPAALFAS